MECSIDMLRLNVRVLYDDFIRFANIYFSESTSVEFYESFKSIGYRYNYTISEVVYLPFDLTSSNNFYVAFMHNMTGTSRVKFDLVIEFNPNKCDISCGLLNLILKTFFNDFFQIDIKSFDLAVDFKGYSIDSLVYDRQFKRRELDYRSNGGRTLYLGERGSHCSCKIYDKAAEQKLDCLWTRVEYTLKPKISFFCVAKKDFDFDFNLPIVNFLDLEFNNIDIKDKCILLCIMRGDVQLSDFSRKVKDRLKKIIYSCTSVSVGNNCRDIFLNCLYDWVFYYQSVIDSNTYDLYNTFKECSAEEFSEPEHVTYEQLMLDLQE